jgi:chromatin structure-remodeling complex subunit SFH1
MIMAPTQAFVTSYATRLAKYGNPLYTPAIPAATIAPTSRTTKRGTTVINYADDAYDDEDFDESEGLRRPTGLRSLRRDETQNKDAASQKLGKEICRPVEVDGIYRDWMTRRTVKPTYDPIFLNFWRPVSHQFSRFMFPRTDQQVHIQSQLPLTLIPIRIDIDIPASQHDPPFPLTRAATEAGFHPGMAAFQRPEPSPAYKIRDVFLWNLHESLLTPDDFAQTLVRELDLPNPVGLTMSISNQIRSQLEEYAGIAMHPLFHHSFKPAVQDVAATRPILNGDSRAVTPRLSLAPPLSRPSSFTPGATTPVQETTSSRLNDESVVAQASLIAAEPSPDLVMQDQPSPDPDPLLNPDDTYRCWISLTISLSSRLYTDKFEWSLLHPPGFAEAFASQTCADLGLNGEWVLAITHAIYEAVLKLKKETFEPATLTTGGGVWTQDGIDNQAVRDEEGAGWRYDAEDFGGEWEPKVEVLSKDEIEKREFARERQLRRARRETAKFSSASVMMPSAREQEAQSRASYFDLPAGMAGGENETPNMGRGERSKKKRKFRSLSPVAKALATPAEGINGAGTGWGGIENKLQEYEKQNWRCNWCLVWGTGVWAVRDGPAGPRVSLGARRALDKTNHCHRLYATTAAFFTRGTRSFPSGQNNYTSMTSRLGGSWLRIVRARFFSFLQTWNAALTWLPGSSSGVLVLCGLRKKGQCDAHGGCVSPEELGHVISR